MSSPRADIRKFINNKFKADSDLEAFLIDHFEDIKKKISNGMDRTQKINILLESASIEQIKWALISLSLIHIAQPFVIMEEN